MRSEAKMKGIKKKISCILAVVMTASAVSPVSAREELPAFSSGASESSVEKAAEILINSRRDSYNPYGISPIGLESYPESFDLRSADLDGSGRKKNYVTPVKSQDPLHNCWGFAAIASAETSILSELGLSYEEYKDKYGVDMDFSEHHLSWFAFTPLPDGNSMLQDGEGLYVADPDEYSAKRMDVGGNPLNAASVFSSGIGPVYEEDCPYRGKNGIIGAYINTETGKLYKTPKEDGTYEPLYYSKDDDWSVDEDMRFLEAYTLEESFMLPSPAQFVFDDDMSTYRYVYNQSYADGIKEQLMKGRAVQIGYNADDKFLNSKTWAHYTPLSANEDIEKGVSADHSVAIVGWDDNFPKENFLEENGLPLGDGAWIVKNSWGSPDGTFPNKSDWGDKGYFYLSYYDHCISTPQVLDFDTTTDDKDSDRYYSFKYDYLPASYYNKYNITDEPAYMANIFATDKNMTIRTLTFQTETPGTKTSFEIYKLDETSETPTDGELLASAEKEYTYGGYHSVDLEDPVFVPANTVFSVVVTNRTSDGKYEIVSDLNDSELGIRQYAVRYRETLPIYYAKSVINPGESYIGNTVDGSVSWNDWKDVTDKSKEISMSLLNKTGYLEQLKKAEKSKEELINALDKYADANPDFDPDNFNEYDLPEDIEALYSRWDADIREFERLEEMIINWEFEGAGFTEAEIADMGETAMKVRDNFPISVIADPVEAVDYTLYYDGETGGFYKEYETGAPSSSPVEEDIPGAVCDGYKLTLTSDFRFITTREDGLHIGKNVELYVPEGEQPTIQSGIEGTEGIDYSNALAADDGCILNIDGVLDISSPDTVNTSTCAINGLGDLVIKGNGTLIAKGGDNVSDESAEAAETTSIGICSTGNLDVSIANLIAQSGNSCSESIGIGAGNYENDIITISGGSHVTARGGSGASAYSVGCLTPSIDISGNSELTVLGGNCGIWLSSEDDEDNKGKKILLSEGSVIDATGEEKGSFGLYYLGEPVLAEMDEDCTFTVRGNYYAAALSELIGVAAFSDGTAVKFDKDRKTYVDASGEIVKEISFRPDNGSSEETTETTTATEETTDITEETSDQPTSEKTEQTTVVRENVKRHSSSGGRGVNVGVPSKAAASDKKESGGENTTANDSTKKTNEPKADVMPKEVRITIGSNIISTDGKKFTVDAAAYIQPESSSTFIPLRFAAIAISGGDVESADTNSTVSWDALSKTASVKTKDAIIKFTAGSNIMYINDKPIVMENGAKAEIKEDRMYIPFRALGTALGAEVFWDGETRTAVYSIK